MAFSKDINELVTEDTTGLLNKHETWERVTLQDVVEVVNGYAFSSSGFNTGKGLPLIRIRDIVSGKTDTTYEGDYSKDYIVNSGDLLVGMDGDFHSAFWRSGIALLNQRVCKLTANENFYNQKFLAYLLPGYLDAINQSTSAVTVKHLSSKTIQSIPLPLPTRKEQDRLVEKLEELFSEFDNGIEELKAAQTKLSQYRQSLLKSAVEGSLTQQWRAENSDRVQETGEQLLARILKQRREQWQQQKLAEFAEKGKTPSKNWQDAYPEPVQPDTTDLPELPKGWVWATIDQCTMDARDITDGPFGSNLKTEHYTKSGPRVIRLQNIGDGVFLDEKAHISKDHYATLSKHAIECGDILVAMMGEFLPRACMVPSGVAPAIVKADCARIRVNSEVLRPKLLTYYLNSNPIRNRTKSAVKGIGRPRINLGYIRSIVVPLPSVIEQKAIADKIDTEFDSIDRQIEATALALKQSEAQRKNILRSAFSGLLVPQDPNDEPASVLLENIKREREALAKIPKPRKPSKPNKKGDLMNTLLEVLTAENDWIDAQDAFQKCGIADGTSTDRIEEIYTELRRLEKAGEIQIQRQGDFDQLKFTKPDVKED